MTFRDRLLATIRAARPVLESPGVMVIGSEVPNLLQADAASTLVVSQDLDIGVPVGEHHALKARLDELHDFDVSPDEPSVWIPRLAGLLELNFVGMDARQALADAYVFEDDRLPLLVFGSLSLVARGAEVDIAGTRLCLPRPAGLLLEKLVTDRTGEKGERDLLVALGLLDLSTHDDLDELERTYQTLGADARHAVRSNLTILSLLAPRPGMPDPHPRRRAVAALLRRLEAVDPERQ